MSVSKAMPPIVHEDYEPEQAVLGSLLIDPFAISRVAEMLEPSDFAIRQHQLIYGAMLRLHEQGKPADYILVASQLNGNIEDAGGYPYLAGLALHVPSSFHADHYAQLVRDMSRRRLLSRATAETLESTADVDGAVDRLETALAEVKRRTGSPEWEDKAASLDRLHARLTGPATADDVGISTGLPTLDRVLRGMKPGDLVTLAARPSLGKTSLATTIAHHAGVKLGLPTAFFSLEMLRDPIWQKLICIDSGIAWRRLSSHEMTREEHDLALLSTRRLKTQPIDVVPAREWTVEKIRAAARTMHAHLPLQLVIVDYLQVIGSERRENRTQEIAALTGSLKGMALELECVVLMLSQLNREPEHRPNSDPRMSDLRDGGTIEQDSDVVVLLSRPEERPIRPPPVELISVIVDKNRLGEVGKVPLGFRGSHMEFVEYIEESKVPGPLQRMLLGTHRREVDDDDDF